MADNTVKIALKASPTDGKANKELIKFLAEEFGTRNSSIRILSGAASRKKLVVINSFSRIPDWWGQIFTLDNKKFQCKKYRPFRSQT